MMSMHNRGVTMPRITARKRAKTARAGAFAQLAGGGGNTYCERACSAVFAAFSTTGTTGGSPVARHFEEGLRTSDSGLRKSSVVRSPMSFVKP